MLADWYDCGTWVRRAAKYERMNAPTSADIARWYAVESLLWALLS